jgi:hypothetical protein
MPKFDSRPCKVPGCENMTDVSMGKYAGLCEAHRKERAQTQSQPSAGTKKTNREKIYSLAKAAGKVDYLKVKAEKALQEYRDAEQDYAKKVKEVLGQQ